MPNAPKSTRPSAVTNYAYRPGQWVLTGNVIFERPEDDNPKPPYFPVCSLRGARKRDRAALILAAPDLLRACEAVVSATRRKRKALPPKLAEALAVASAAIEKAKRPPE